MTPEFIVFFIVLQCFAYKFNASFVCIKSRRHFALLFRDFRLFVTQDRCVGNKSYIFGFLSSRRSWLPRVFLQTEHSAQSGVRREQFGAKRWLLLQCVGLRLASSGSTLSSVPAARTHRESAPKFARFHRGRIGILTAVKILSALTLTLTLHSKVCPPL